MQPLSLRTATVVLSVKSDASDDEVIDHLASILPSATFITVTRGVTPVAVEAGFDTSSAAGAPANVPKRPKAKPRVEPDNAKLLAKLRAMRPNTRAKFFRTADPATIEALTEPCTGEAHRNAHIDHCMVCLYCTWGRVLKAEPSAEVAPCNPTP